MAEGLLHDPAVLRIRVCEAAPGQVWMQDCELAPGATVQEALIAAGYATRVPVAQWAQLSVGIFGKRCALTAPVSDGDRVELYRPLVFDPMESRRRRAELKAQGMPGMQRRRRRSL